MINVVGLHTHALRELQDWNVLKYITNSGTEYIQDAIKDLEIFYKDMFGALYTEK